MFLAEVKKENLSSAFGWDLCPAIKHCFCNVVSFHVHLSGEIHSLACGVTAPDLQPAAVYIAEVAPWQEALLGCLGFTCDWGP